MSKSVPFFLYMQAKQGGFLSILAICKFLH